MQFDNQKKFEIDVGQMMPVMAAAHQHQGVDAGYLKLDKHDKTEQLGGQWECYGDYFYLSFT